MSLVHGFKICYWIFWLFSEMFRQKATFITIYNSNCQHSRLLFFFSGKYSLHILYGIVRILRDWRERSESISETKYFILLDYIFINACLCLCTGCKLVLQFCLAHFIKNLFIYSGLVFITDNLFHPKTNTFLNQKLCISQKFDINC